jgi:hypothetical protein
MPGASWTNPGQLIAERSAKELIGIFVVLPVLVGVGTLAVVIRNATVNATERTNASAPSARRARLSSGPTRSAFLLFPNPSALGPRLT